MRHKLAGLRLGIRLVNRSVILTASFRLPIADVGPPREMSDLPSDVTNRTSEWKHHIYTVYAQPVATFGDRRVDGPVPLEERRDPLTRRKSYHGRS